MYLLLFMLMFSMCIYTDMILRGVLLLSMLVLGCHALYSPSDDVYDLTADNFQKMVLDSHFVWIVEFYAPW